MISSSIEFNVRNQNSPGLNDVIEKLFVKTCYKN